MHKKPLPGENHAIPFATGARNIESGGSLLKEGTLIFKRERCIFTNGASICERERGTSPDEAPGNLGAGGI